MAFPQNRISLWKENLEDNDVEKNPQRTLNLEAEIVREKAVQVIYVHRKFLQLVVTLPVVRDVVNFLGA